jgi:hypothetical protein
MEDEGAAALLVVIRGLQRSPTSVVVRSRSAFLTNEKWCGHLLGTNAMRSMPPNKKMTSH